MNDIMYLTSGIFLNLWGFKLIFIDGLLKGKFICVVISLLGTVVGYMTVIISFILMVTK